MANIFFRKDEKASKAEASRTLILKISDYFDGRFEVFFTHDDGGAILEIMVEVPEPSGVFEDQISSFPTLAEILPKWAGWRTVLSLAPPGYIDAIKNRRAEDDY